jgi:SOS-response transcriptional repressor LexA
MFGHSSAHFQLNWVKERIDEMDASLASLERSARKAKSQSSSDAKRLVAALKKRRARFETIVKKQAKDNDIAWQRGRAQLEAEWKKFEAEAAHHLKTATQQVEQKVAFRRASGVQARALRGAVEKLQDLAGTIVPARRTGFKAVIGR